MGLRQFCVICLAIGATASTTAGQEDNTNSLSATECKVPVAAGGWGFCGAQTCNTNYKTCGGSNGGGPPTVNGVTGSWRPGYSASTCVNYYNLQSSSAHQPNALPSAHAPQGSCRTTCTQRTTGICSGTFLANVLKGRGVKYAYCNDKWLVIGATGEPGHWTPNLNDVPNPPGTTVSGVELCTGEVTMTVGIARTTFFPLDLVDLPTGVSTNNIHLFDGTSGISGNTGPITNRDSSSSIGATAYGLPDGAGVGTMVNGMSDWVTQNNQGHWNQGTCEADSCNLHVGQGGGQPHVHGDMFADTHTCLYGSSNYSRGVNGHPPVIGFANDGHLIYGRYLSNSAPGFAAPLLDQCGGHKHDVTTDVDEHGLNLHTNYHYHTQVFDAVCGASDRCTSGEAYTVSSTGPLFCYRANLTASEGSAALLGATSRYGATQNQMNYRCCGMTDYYMLNGVPDGVSGASTTFAASSKCTLPAIANGAYETSGSCIVGATMYSGYQCTPTCNAGYAASGKTRCVKGVLVETATCVMPSPSPQSPSPPPPSPSPPPPTSMTPSTVPSAVPGAEANPCFPSTATVIKADGGAVSSVVSIASLKEGDVILAAAADGTLTTDTVSLLSIAKPEATATFITLTIAAGKSLNLTAEHHLPIGPVCCSTLKQAKDIAVGETVWTVTGAVSGAATVAATVSAVSRAVKKGLHSPVLAAGSFPIVDGFVTSFDTLQSVTLASYGLPALLHACKATGMCAAVQRGFGALVGRSTADFVA